MRERGTDTQRERMKERGRDRGGRGSAHILPFLQRYLSGNDNMSVPVHMAITLDISADKVDTKLPLMPLHRVWPFVCLSKGRHIRKGPEGPSETFAWPVPEWDNCTATAYGMPHNKTVFLGAFSRQPKPRCIPCALHGDAMTVFKRKIAMCSVVVAPASM